MPVHLPFEHTAVTVDVSPAAQEPYAQRWLGSFVQEVPNAGTDAGQGWGGGGLQDMRCTCHTPSRQRACVEGVP